MSENSTTLDYRTPSSRRRWSVADFFLSAAGRALIALILVIAVGCIYNADGTFFLPGVHRDTLRQSAEYGILACGMTLVIISGGIDLSVGSVLGLTSVIFSLAILRWNWSPWLAIPFALLVGAACGAISGGLIATLRLQPFIATLAMMAFARGLAKAPQISGGQKIAPVVSNPDGTFQAIPIPAIFKHIDARVFDGNVAMVSLIFLVCLIVTWFLLSRHRWGRQLYAIGGNEEAARLSGVPVQRAKILAYIACGMLSAVAGICEASQSQQGDPEAGNTFELTAIAIAVIGGTSLAGGRGGMGLTLLGMLTIGYLQKILSINGVPEAYRLMLTGAIIVLAVLAQRRRTA